MISFLEAIANLAALCGGIVLVAHSAKHGAPIWFPGQQPVGWVLILAGLGGSFAQWKESQ